VPIARCIQNKRLMPSKPRILNLPWTTVTGIKLALQAHSCMGKCCSLRASILILWMHL
jgi:hypothetical protein